MCNILLSSCLSCQQVELYLAEFVGDCPSLCPDVSGVTGGWTAGFVASACHCNKAYQSCFKGIVKFSYENVLIS